MAAPEENTAGAAAPAVATASADAITELLFVGVACTEAAIAETVARHYGGRAEVRPQQHFDLAVAKALSQGCGVSAVSEPPVASYPRSSCVVYRRAPDRVSPTLEIRYLTVVNLPVIKTLLVSAGVLVEALRFLLRAPRRRRAVVVGYISIHTALPVLILARALGVPVLAIVPDLPRLVATYGRIANPVRCLGAWALAACTRAVHHRFDAYVFLAPAMNSSINVLGRPFIVMEGMADEAAAGPVPADKLGCKVVMYAGTLHERFGIRTLVEAFARPELREAELWVYGNGDYEEQVRRMSTAHPNIVYKGTVSRADALKLERSVALLVNPRPSADELTMYSFPSKTIEYMASGTPLVTTRLGAIPPEYGPYLYWFDDESPVGMARRISELLAQPPGALQAFGAAAREFVLRHKTAVAQGRRILSLVSSVPGR